MLRAQNSGVYSVDNEFEVIEMFNGSIVREIN